jgi:hypothetical protein
MSIVNFRALEQVQVFSQAQALVLQFLSALVKGEERELVKEKEKEKEKEKVAPTERAAPRNAPAVVMLLSLLAEVRNPVTTVTATSPLHGNITRPCRPIW